MEVILLISGAIFGGLISWYITNKYYEKSSREQKDLLDNLSQELKDTNTLKYFEILIERSKWKKEFIGQDEAWVAEENNTFQIQSGDPGREFHEEWTKMYPDQGTIRYPVYLKINNTIIKELIFISLDGGRIYVPMPDRKSENDKISFFWNINSLEMKVCKIIGHYYIYKDIYGVARRSRIDIIE